MTPLVAIAATVMGIVLGTLGGGGSILSVPILVYLVGIDEKSAIATSLLIVGVTSAVAALAHARSGNVIWKTGLIFGAFAMVGSAGGGWIAQFIDGSVLLTLFAAFMIVTAVMMFRGKKKNVKPVSAGPIWKVGIEGIAVGAFTGLVGAGGGFLVVPALVLLGGLEMRKAIGTSLLVIAMKSLSGVAMFATHVTIDYTMAAIFAGLAIVGTLIGKQIAQRVNATKLRTYFAGFVLLMGLVVISQQLSIDGWIASIIGIGIVGFTILKSTRLRTEESI